MIDLQKMRRFRYVHCRCAAFLLPRDVHPAIFPCRAAVRSGLRRVARNIHRCCLSCIGMQDRDTRYDQITETPRVIMILYFQYAAFSTQASDCPSSDPHSLIRPTHTTPDCPHHSTNTPRDLSICYMYTTSALLHPTPDITLRDQ